MKSALLPARLFCGCDHQPPERRQSAPRREYCQTQGAQALQRELPGWSRQINCAVRTGFEPAITAHSVKIGPEPSVITPGLCVLSATGMDEIRSSGDKRETIFVHRSRIAAGSVLPIPGPGGRARRLILRLASRGSFAFPGRTMRPRLRMLPYPASRGFIVMQGLSAAGANAPWPLFRPGSMAMAHASIWSGAAGGSNGSTGSGGGQSASLRSGPCRAGPGCLHS